MRPWIWAVGAFVAVGAGRAPAWAYELSGGVAAGGVLAGTVPRFAVSPQAGISWRFDGGFHVAARDMCSVLPKTGRLGVGVYNQVTLSLGYAGDTFDIAAGPALSAYSMPACGAALCGRVVGAAPGGRAQLDLYLPDQPLGLAVTAGVDWLGGRSRVLPGGVAGMIVVGPVLRWRSP